MLGLLGGGRKTTGCWQNGNDDTFDVDLNQISLFMASKVG